MPDDKREGRLAVGGRQAVRGIFDGQGGKLRGEVEEKG